MINFLCDQDPPWPFLREGGTPTLGLLILTGEKVIVPIHEEADRLSHHLEPMLTQHGGDAFGGSADKKCLRIQTGSNGAA